MYIIEKHVPIPEKQKWGLLWMLDSMEVWDSFVFEKEKSNSINSSTSKIAREKWKKFSMKTINGVSRMWRIK